MNALVDAVTILSSNIQEAHQPLLLEVRTIHICERVTVLLNYMAQICLCTGPGKTQKEREGSKLTIRTVHNPATIPSNATMGMHPYQSK